MQAASSQSAALAVFKGANRDKSKQISSFRICAG